ncbi:MAG: winged helix-turn-helix domain-containing protein [Candidatus Thorarchaeota archaeon]|nr:winged helix-turn-helix domain-containing protein [Candidatus Thorarchaeota archaeon]
MQQDGEDMSGNHEPNWGSVLSPSARALMKTIRNLEDDVEIDLFQPGPEIERLGQIVASHKGSLHASLKTRIVEVLALGGIDVITQRDLWTLIEDLWCANVSKFSPTELTVLKGSVEHPREDLRNLARSMSLTYSQTRRAIQRLRLAGVLAKEGLLNFEKMGLQQILIILEAPKLVVSSPYITKTLFVDGPNPMVFQVASMPIRYIDDIQNIIRSLRGTSFRASCWYIYRGQLMFNGKYCDRRGEWNLDLFHWKMQLRREDEDLVIGEQLRGKEEVMHLTPVDLRILDTLIENYDATASEIVEATGISESTAFRRRSQILEKNVIMPRCRIRIPQLKDRVLVITSPNCAGSILRAWSQLPVTYTTRLENIETHERKVLLFAAIPLGTTDSLLKALNSSMSRVDDYAAYSISAGSEVQLATSFMFNRKEMQWKWNKGDLLDARTYEIVRRECEGRSIPVDLV